jgi:hypothetical protein
LYAFFTVTAISENANGESASDPPQIAPPPTLPPPTARSCRVGGTPAPSLAILLFARRRRQAFNPKAEPAERRRQGRVDPD